MVRSSRLAVLALVGLLAGACGDAPPSFGLVLDTPDASQKVVPFPVAYAGGHATAVRSLAVRVGAGDETYAFEAKPGITLAFRVHGEAPPPPVALPGLDDEPPAPEAVMGALRERLGERVPEATVREPVGEGAFLVDLPGDRDDLVAAASGAVLAAPDLRFLVEVRPRARYVSWRGGRAPPRLVAPPYPWDGTDEAFDAYREAEVERWRKARQEGVPYVPSREDLFVLPRFGSPGTDVLDYLVLEWPREEAERFDGRMLGNPRVARDPTNGRPVVLYEIREAYREAFGAWTEANIGLPMAIVMDWAWLSAPLVNARLEDSVQITLGSGAFAEMEEQAHLLVRALGGSGSRVPVDLVAVVLWESDGAFEVLLPLEERVDTALVLEAAGAGDAERARVERSLRLVPSLLPDGRSNVDARLAEILLGRIDAEIAAPLLRVDVEAAIERLAWWARRSRSYRSLAATALLGKVDPRAGAAAEALVGLLDHENAGVRVAAAQALHEPARHDDRAFEALLGASASADETLGHTARMALHGLGPQRREALVERLHDEDPRVRGAALGALGSEPDPSVIPHLLAALDDEDVEMRRLALGVLQMAAWNDPSALRGHQEAIAARLGDEDRDVRLQAAQTLAELGEEAVDAVRPFARAEDAATRAAALYALSGLARTSRDALEAMKRGLDDPALSVRVAAALGYLRPEKGEARRIGAVEPERVQRVLPILEEAVASPDPVERRVGVTLLWAAGPAAAAAADALRALLDDDEEQLRVYAAAALERMEQGDARSREILDAVEADPGHPLHGIEHWVE